MLRLLIIAHTPLASALQAVATHIDPDAAVWIGACDVRADQSQEDVIAAANLVLDSMGPGDTLVLTDVFGATPCNAARRLGERSGIRVVAGVNVPALWRAVGHLHEPLDHVAELVVSGGQQGLMNVSVTRPQNQASKTTYDDPQLHHHQQ